MTRFTIIALAGDNGDLAAVGTFRARESAQLVADRWQAKDNPDLDPDGMRYTVSRIRRLSEWD